MIKEVPTLEKITKLKAKLFGSESDDMDKVLEWERQAKNALIDADLAEHEAIQRIITKVKEDIEEIDYTLKTAYSKDISDGDRDRFLDVKKFYEWFLSFFVVAQTRINDLNSTLDNELNDEEYQDIEL